MLEALGLNVREPLAAAADMYAEAVDNERRIGYFAENGDDRVSHVMEVAFHSEDGDEASNEDHIHG